MSAALTKMSDMSYFADRMQNALSEKGLSPYKLAIEAKLDTGLLYKVLKGERAPSDSLLEKIAGVPELALTMDTLKAWRAVDDIGMDAIKQAAMLLPSDVIKEALELKQKMESGE